MNKVYVKNITQIDENKSVSLCSTSETDLYTIKWDPFDGDSEAVTLSPKKAIAEDGGIWVQCKKNKHTFIFIGDGEK